MNRRTTLIASLLALAACGGDAPPAQTPSSANSGGTAAAPAAELSAKEMEQGIGPIHDMELGPLDAALATTGEAAFVMKCSACHKIEERYIGPELGQVLARRTPEFVMNQMLNANEMVQRHPVVKQMLAEYYTPMPVQVTDHDEARAILEYLRSVQTEAPSTSNGSSGGL